jgi:hypothetical protein
MIWILIAGVALCVLAFGVGAGALLDRTLVLIHDRLAAAPLKAALGALATIFGWFLGSGGMTLGLLWLVDFAGLGVPQPVGRSVAVVAYMGGFGLGTLLPTTGARKRSKGRLSNPCPSSSNSASS